MNKAFLTFLKSLCLVTVLLGILASCSARRQDYTACPNIRVLKDTDKLTRFKPGDGRDITDIVLNAELIRAGGGCEVFQESVRVNMEILVRANQGALNGANTHEVDLIVGIVGPDGKLVAPAPIGHRKMPMIIDFPLNSSIVDYQEFIEIDIPKDVEQDGDEFRIYVSLGLSEEEYQFNKTH